MVKSNASWNNRKLSKYLHCVNSAGNNNGITIWCNYSDIGRTMVFGYCVIGTVMLITVIGSIIVNAVADFVSKCGIGEIFNEL